MDLTTITFKKVEYVECSQILEKAPIYTKGSRNTRTLIKKKEIPEDMYIFAKKNEEGRWVKTNGDSIKFDKILLKKEYLKNIPEFQEKEDDKMIVDENGISEAPEILDLEDNEKFKDDENNIIDIETRGKRDCNGIYFRVKDVETHFDLKQLSVILGNKNTSYERNTDYCYFNCKRLKTYTNNKNIVNIKKEVFLTLTGLRKLIEVSRLKFSSQNKNIIHKWANQNFDYAKIFDFTISLQNDILKSKIGYTYCITSRNINVVKIGFWRSSLQSLRARYTTYFGKNLIIFIVLTKDARALEKKCHEYFVDNCIEGELFEPEYWSDYISFLEENVVIPDRIHEKTEQIIDYDKILNINRCEETEEMYLNKYIDDNRESCQQSQFLYRYNIGTCKDLRETMKISQEIPDNHNIITHGFTNNIMKKTKELENTYNMIKGVKLELMNYVLIDPRYISKAEVDIKEYYTTIETKIQYKTFDELVAVNPKHEKEINKQHKYIAIQYSGCVKELMDTIDNLRRENEKEKLKIENIEKIHKLELEKKDEQHKSILRDEQFKLREEQFKNQLLLKELEYIKMADRKHAKK
jgi:hypothetical protein